MADSAYGATFFLASHEDSPYKKHDGLPRLPATTPVALVGATSAIGGGRDLLDPMF